MKKFQLTLLVDSKKYELESDNLVHITAQLMLILVRISEELSEEELEILKRQHINDEEIPF